MSLTDAILASNCNWFRTGLAVVVPASSDRSLINMFVALLDVTVHALKPAYVSLGWTITKHSNIYFDHIYCTYYTRNLYKGKIHF